MDITHLVERLESFENKLGIAVNGIRVTISDDCDHDNEYSMRVTGEVLSLGDDPLDDSIELTVAVYAPSGSILKVDSHYIDNDNFLGFDVFELNMYLDSNDIQKVLVFPKS